MEHGISSRTAILDSCSKGILIFFKSVGVADGHACLLCSS
jgi:hypothetical protein